MLACGNKSSQILVEVSYLSIGLVADVRMRLWWWSTFCIASIRRNCWADDVDKSIHELGYVFLCCMSNIIL